MTDDALVEFRATGAIRPRPQTGSLTDPLAPKQYCELHQAICETVVPFRRKFPGKEHQDEIILVCPLCIRKLRQAGLARPSQKWAGFNCEEILAPPRPCGHRTGNFTVVLTPLQVIYLRALGFKLHKE